MFPDPDYFFVNSDSGEQSLKTLEILPMNNNKQSQWWRCTMNINNANGISPKEIQQYLLNETLGKGREVPEEKPSAIPQEKVDISNKAREIQQISSKMTDAQDIREDKVAAIKSQIDDGTYNVSGEEVANKMLGENFLDIFAWFKKLGSFQNVHYVIFNVFKK